MIRRLAAVAALGLLPLTLNVYPTMALAAGRVSPSAPNSHGWSYFSGTQSWSNINCAYNGCLSTVYCGEEAQTNGAVVYPVMPLENNNTVQCRDSTGGTPGAHWHWYWEGCTGAGTYTLSCGGNFTNDYLYLYNCWQFRIYLYANGTFNSQAYQSASNWNYPCD